MENVIIILILAVLVGGAVSYIVRAKQSGVKCIGCPAGGSCSGKKMKKKKLSGAVIAKKTIDISGMNCAHCAQSVTDGLNQIEGVSARVDLSKGCAVVSFDREIDEDVLIRAVEKKGFAVKSIHA